LREKLRMREMEYANLLKQLEKRKASDPSDLDFAGKSVVSNDSFEPRQIPRVRLQNPSKNQGSPVINRDEPFSGLNKSFDYSQPDYSQFSSPLKASSSFDLPPKYQPSPKPTLKSSNIFELAAHPAFSQPRFTKSKPKLHNRDPIVGYRSPQPKLEGSPEQRRGMAGYGNMMFNQ
jgi:hypothetical protein